MQDTQPTTDRNTPPTTTRRNVIKGVAGIGTAAAFGRIATGSAIAQEGFDGWFDNVDNYDGVVDKTGQTEVAVTVGAEANGGGFGFGPAAIRVDPGTTVTWEWNGNGGSHNVVADDGSYESDLVSDAGHTFTHTFDSDGISKYYCAPHQTMGMKGAVVVGDIDVGTAASSGDDGSEDGGDGDAATGDDGSASTEPDYGDWFENVSNFDGTVDKTGTAEVTVSVGAEANGGGFGFAPPALRVSPGTTVTWEWTGNGGSHNVVATDGAYESELVGDEGHTFNHTCESSGLTKYVCVPHESMGMKGAVYVDQSAASIDAMQAPEPEDNPGGTEVTIGELAFVGSVVAGLLSPLAVGRSGSSREQDTREKDDSGLE